MLLLGDAAPKLRAPQRFLGLDDRGFDAKARYYHPDLGDDDPDEGPEADPQAGHDLALTKIIGAHLHFHYHGHNWQVTVKSRQWGGVSIRLDGIMPTEECEFIRLRDLASDPSLRLVLTAGGRILERYRLPRTHFSRTAWRDALTAHPLSWRSADHAAPA